MIITAGTGTSRTSLAAIAAALLLACLPAAPARAGGGCCDGGELPEGEPCGADTNGGCNSTPPVFTEAGCNSAWCGLAWADGGTRDTDWYLVQHPGGPLSGTLESAFAGVVFIVDGLKACVPVVVGETGESVGCGPGTATADLPAGPHAVFVAAGAFDGTPCGSGSNQYRLTISCGGPCVNAEGNCGLPNGTPGCDDEECCALVCGLDPFCCNTEWDQICADEALANCVGICGAAISGDCFVPNGSPACDDLECCKEVCAIDPFCCDTEWDGICAGEAADLCVTLPCPGEGNCFQDNGTPGCQDLECCEAVCAVDPFCCDVEWDGICADEAVGLCGSTLCGPGAGPCDQPNGTPGCDDIVCCNKVCLIAPFCCTVQWDAACAEEALAVCDFSDPCEGAEGSCFEPNDTPGCDDFECCAAVCAEDPFCCDVAWDQLCVDRAELICVSQCKEDIDGNGIVDVVDLVEVILDWDCVGACIGDVNNDGVTDVQDLVLIILAWGPCAPVSDCCVPHPTPGCASDECTALVCGLDPFCCEVEWSLACAVLANEVCGECGGEPPASDCCVAHAYPACEDQQCVKIVCTLDPYCCQIEWNQQCADEALAFCPGCGGMPPETDCCLPHPNPGCDDPDCTAQVCAIDPFCCDIAWNQGCVNEAGLLCVICPSPGGDCCAAHGGPGCEDVPCATLVCEIDPYCCQVQWNQQCAGEAALLCDICPSPPSDCCVAHAYPGCDDLPCVEAVCTIDPFCCQIAWNQQCADEASLLCDICPAPPSDCCVANGTPGCEDEECSALICAMDPFCCEVQWNTICAEAAQKLCGVCPDW